MEIYYLSELILIVFSKIGSFLIVVVLVLLPYINEFEDDRVVPIICDVVLLLSLVFIGQLIV